MPVYKNLSLTDYPFYNILNCPFCTYTNKNIKNRSDILKHIKKCNEYERDNDNIEDDIIDETEKTEETLRSHLDWKVNIINTVKKFIKSNELRLLENQTPEQIREYIKTKIVENIMISPRMDLDIFWIYKEFFEMNEIEDDKYMKVIENYCI